MSDALEQALLDQASPQRRFEAMAHLRRHQPIRRILGESGPYYLASRSAVLRALPEIDHFGGAVGAPDGPEDEKSFNGLPEPKHGEIRKIVNSFIAPHKSRRARPFVEDVSGSLLDGVCERAARGEPVEVMEAFADLVPSSTIAWLLGWPVEDAAKMYRWTADGILRAMHNRPGVECKLVDVVPEFVPYIEDKLAERQALPPGEWPDDAMTRFLTAEIDGGRLSTAFVRTQLHFLLGSGAETTRNIIGGLLYSLLSEPGLYARLREDRALLPNAIEESLRVYSPTQFMVRECIQPIEIDGQPIALGEQVFIGLASANRDETLFDRSETFDPERTNADQHVAFGGGPHVCPGSSLARMETEVAIDAFLDRFVDATLVDGPGFEPPATPMFYGPKTLPLRLELAR